MVLAVFAAMIVGFSKPGIAGGGLVVVPILATIFGPKESVGVLLPMLCVADVCGLAYHRKNAQWPLLVRLLPWVLPGIVLGYVALGSIPGKHMGKVLSVLVLLIIAFKLAQDRGGERLAERLPRQWWFPALMGITAGFATMLGNLAGSLMAVYLLSMGLDKRRLMGTAVWYFFLINLIKIPFSAHRGLITADSLLFDLKTVPFILLGAGIGILAFRRISQKWFERVILILAAIAAVRLLFM